MAKPKTDNNTVYLIDGSGYIFRAYYAIRHLRSRKGIPTNAVFGFTNMLLKLLREYDPKYVAIAFDTKAPTFRHALYAGYKAHRPPPPEDLVPQFALIHQVVDCFRIKRLIMEGFEADDIIGTMAKRAKDAGHEVVVVTGDKDFMQLVDDGVYLLDELRATNHGEEFIDEAAVLQQMHVLPKHIVDLLALMGDASDNVPGVSGIGKKTAAELINEFGPLETILQMLPLIKQSARRHKLEDGRQDAILSKQLVCIDTSVPVLCAIDDLHYEGLDRDQTRALFLELDFNRLLADKKLFGNETGVPETHAPKHPQDSPSVNVKAYQAITTKEAFLRLIEDLKAVTTIAVDTETDGLDSMVANLVGISFAWADNVAVYLPLAHEREAVALSLTVSDVQKAINEILSNPAKTFVAQNAKYDYKILVRHGFTPFAIGGDPMLASYLLHQDQERHNLDDLSKKYLQHKPISFEEVCGEKKNQIPFSKVGLARATEYAAEDADLALRLDNLFASKLTEQRLDKLYHEIELPLEGVLARMEMQGVALDVSQLSLLKEEIEARLIELKTTAYQLAGETFNLASPKQVSSILFEKLKLPAHKKGKSGFSTDSEVLEKLVGTHAIAAVLLDFRMYHKLLSTYVETLPTLINPRTGRVHTSYNQFVTATGRLSSSDPNLQNIPRRTPEGRRIRRAFVAETGKVLIALDYSQVELRLLAYASQDRVLVDSFKHNEDVHQRTASEIFEVPLDQVTKDMRSAAKTINFGLLYGMGALRLSQTLNIPRKQASEYLEKYFAKYAGVLSWKESCLQKAKEKGEVRTFFGRLRTLDDLNSKNSLLRSRAERIAINTPIQGSAADIIKIAMIKSEQFLTQSFPDSHLILQVHDELVIEAREADAETVAARISEIMRHSHGLDVDLRVDYAIASNWDDAH